MISKFSFSATGNGASLTYAEVGTVPASAAQTRKDSDANVSGGSVNSKAGPIAPAAGRSATTTSSVTTAAGRSNLLLVLDVTGSAMKATGFAQHGLQYVSRSPVDFELTIDELELDGEHASLDFRLEQPEDGDHLHEVSEEAAPFSGFEKLKFESVPAHMTLFRLQLKLLMMGDKPRLQVHCTNEREIVVIQPKISPRDFEFDDHKRVARYIGHLDKNGKRVRTVHISIDPGRTSKENNLILTLLGTQSAPKAARRKPKLETHTAL